MFQKDVIFFSTADSVTLPWFILSNMHFLTITLLDQEGS